MFWGIPATFFLPCVLLVGATFIMFVYHGILYLHYRERIIWKYCFYLGAISLYLLLDLYKTSDFYRAAPFATQQLSTAVNFIVILGYSSFLMEVVNEYRKRFTSLFLLWSVLYYVTIAYIIFQVTAALLKWEIQGWELESVSNFFRLCFVVVGLLAIYRFYPVIKGRFMNLVKWGGMVYLVFMILVLVTMILPGMQLLGLAPMHFVYLGTFADVLLFSYAMSIKIKESLSKAAELRQHLSRDLHDEVGATLSGVTLMSELATERIKAGKTEDTRQIIQRITAESKEMAEKMNDIVWAINPQNDTLEKVLNKIQQYGNNLCRSRQIHFHFERAPGQDESLNMLVRNSIYLISKEAVNNAVKYSGARNIYFSFSGKRNDYLLRVEDDGIGFDPANTVPGNGLGNMMARAKAIGSQLKIFSQIGKGTKLEMSFG